MNTSETSSIASSNTILAEETNRRANLKDLVPKFDPKEIDITLFFMMFECRPVKIMLKKIDGYPSLFLY